MNYSPPGGLPYHPKESARENDLSAGLIVRTGLSGIFVLFLCAFWSVFLLTVSSPFLLLGVAELVALRPTHYRVRWIRRDPS